MEQKNDYKEIQYVNILNQILPDDIRISAVSLIPINGFDARFSCINRHYKYLFNGDGLDISSMDIGAHLFEGEHDFRNFCKLDGSKQITNYKRTIISSKIEKINDTFYCDYLHNAYMKYSKTRVCPQNLLQICHYSFIGITYLLTFLSECPSLTK